jgi:hypothetical protein
MPHVFNRFYENATGWLYDFDPGTVPSSLPVAAPGTLPVAAPVAAPGTLPVTRD